MKYYQHRGFCPCCDSDDIEYDDTVYSGDNIGYIGVCSACQAVFTEWYSMEYVETELERPGKTA
jgi:hypothetical protein